MSPLVSGRSAPTAGRWHDIGTDPARDVLVFTEDDERFEATVRATRSGAYILIETACRDTTETLVIPAAEAGPGPSAA